MRASKYSPEFRERAVHIARESERAISAVARDLGIHPETLRVWVRQDEADNGTRTDRLTTAEREELAALRRENRDLRRSNEILKAASVFFARELDRRRHAPGGIHTGSARSDESTLPLAASTGSSRSGTNSATRGSGSPAARLSGSCARTVSRASATGEYSARPCPASPQWPPRTSWAATSPPCAPMPSGSRTSPNGRVLAGTPAISLTRELSLIHI